MTLPGGLGGGLIAQGLVRVLPDTSRFAQQLTSQTSTALERVSARAAVTGKKLTKSVTLPVLGIGTAILGVGTTFEDNMSRIRGLVGASESDMASYETAIERIGPATAKGPGELSDALFFITSAGLEGQEALDALESSARASAAGLGETAVVADAVTSAMNAYGPGVLNAGKATDILVATVREGKLEADQLAGSIGRVIPVAANLGVSFDQVGAAIAAMTRLGLDANESATALRGVMSTLVKPSSQAQEQLKAVGLSAEGLRRQVREEGLLAVLLTLEERFGDNEEAMAKVFPNVRALTGVLNLVGENADTTQSIFNELTDTTGSLDRAFSAAEQTTSFKLRKAMAQLQAAAVKLMVVVAPVATAVAGFFGKIADAISTVPAPMLKVVGGAVGIAAAIGPLLLVGSKLIRMLAVMRAGFLAANLAAAAKGGAGGLLGGIMRLTVAHPVLTGVVAASAIGIGLWTQAQAKARERVKALRETLDEQSGAVTRNTKEWLANLLVEKDVDKALENTNITMGEYVDAITEGGDATQQMRDRLAEAAEAGDLSWGEYIKLDKILERYTRRVAKAQEEEERQRAALDSVSGSAVMAREEIGELSGAQQMLQDETEAAKDRALDLVAAVDEEVVPTMEEVVEAQRAARDMMAEWKEQAKAAMEEMSSTITGHLDTIVGDWSGSMDEMDLELGEMLAGLRDRVAQEQEFQTNLQRLADLGMTALATRFRQEGPKVGSALRQVLDSPQGLRQGHEMNRILQEEAGKAIGGLSTGIAGGNIPPIRMRAEADTSQVRAAISDLERQRPTLRLNVRTNQSQITIRAAGSGVYKIKALQHGGRFFAGETILVGEGGVPELLTFDTGGVVTPLARAGRAPMPVAARTPMGQTFGGIGHATIVLKMDEREIGRAAVRTVPGVLEVDTGVSRR